MNKRLLLLGSGSGAATPASISNLEFWARASDETFQDAACTIVAGDTDPVRCWGDLSGQLGGDPTSQSDAERPIRGDALIGSQPALDFDGTNDQFQIIAANSTNLERDHNEPFSVWTVVNIDSFAQANTIIEKSRASDSRGYQYYIATSGVAFLDFLHLTSNRIGKASATTLSTGVDYALTLTVSGNGLASGVNHYLNGVLDNGTVFNDSLSGLTTLGGADAFIGELMNSIHMNGKMAEIAFYSKELSAGERAILNDYATDRYGI